LSSKVIIQALISLRLLKEESLDKREQYRERHLCALVSVSYFNVFLSEQITLYELFSTSFDFSDQLDSFLCTSSLNCYLSFLETEVTNYNVVKL